MGDIVERLRGWEASIVQIADALGDEEMFKHGDLCLEAALEVDRLRSELSTARDRALDALEASATALDDWLNSYAQDCCDPLRVVEAVQRINEHGTLAYIAEVQAKNRDAIHALKTKGEE